MGAGPPIQGWAALTAIGVFVGTLVGMLIGVGVVIGTLVEVLTGVGVNAGRGVPQADKTNAKEIVNVQTFFMLISLVRLNILFMVMGKLNPGMQSMG